MSGQGRPVDLAMDAERPEKVAIRELWIEKVVAQYKKKKEAQSAERLYLTLCGAEGRDLEMLIGRGILELTETGSLTVDSAALIGAIAGQCWDWSLLLTLHGEAAWPNSIWGFITDFLAQNFEQIPEFQESATKILGTDLVEAVKEGNSQIVSQAGAAHQRLLLALVPKLIADKLRDHRWSIEIDWSFLYGGNGTAPMVTWALDFIRGGSGTTTAQIYAANVSRMLERAASIDPDGNMVDLN